VNDLRFTPNPAAQNLASSKTYAVAFVIRRRLIHAENPFYDAMMVGVERELEQHGYHLVAITIDDEPSRDLWMPPGLDKRRLDGMFVAGCELSDRVMTTLLSLGIPTVLVANSVRHGAVDAVTSDNRAGGFAATEHLIRHGHRHVAFVGGPRTWAPIFERMQGYHEAMLEHGLTPILQLQPNLYIDAGAAALYELLGHHPEVTAVFAASDPLAIGVMRAAQEMGRRVPDDLAIIGYDNIVWAETTTPPLTTIHIQKEKIGQIAARRLLEVLRGEALTPVKVEVSNDIVIRESCGCKPTTPPQEH
ncbi:MAG: substrate-binding domain-containing protein, partial [Anaerolineae bacterium]|nr:substrate-binding domain-containing protein [Anaerolineae bacterium]